MRKSFGRILEEFGLDKADAHIVNGHVPWNRSMGITINAAVSCWSSTVAFQSISEKTGIAGYTLIYNSYGLILAAHEPFESTEAAIEKESEYTFRQYRSQTDIGT